MKTIGVTVIDYITMFTGRPLISDLLYFDEIQYINAFDDSILRYYPSTTLHELHRKQTKEIEDLERHGLLQEFQIDSIRDDVLNSPDDSEIDKLVTGAALSIDILESMHTRAKSDIPPDRSDSDLRENYFLHHMLVCQFMNRMYCAALNNKSSDHFISIIKSGIDEQCIIKASQPMHAISVILKNFPEISTDDHLEKLVDFKKDPQTTLKLKRFREWVSDLVKKGLTDKELNQKLEVLLMEYTNHMDIHNLKYKVSKAQAIVIPTVEFIESFPFFKFSKPLKTNFELELNRINLLDAENKAPGREVAYVQKAKELFSHPKSP